MQGHSHARKQGEASVDQGHDRGPCQKPRPIRRALASSPSIAASMELGRATADKPSANTSIGWAATLAASAVPSSVAPAKCVTNELTTNPAPGPNDAPARSHRPLSSNSRHEYSAEPSPARRENMTAKISAAISPKAKAPNGKRLGFRPNFQPPARLATATTSRTTDTAAAYAWRLPKWKRRRPCSCKGRIAATTAPVANRAAAERSGTSAGTRNHTGSIATAVNAADGTERRRFLRREAMR